MSSTTSRPTSRGPAQSFTEEALQVVARVEREIVRHEELIGRERLLRAIAAFGMQAYVTHTGYYRRVIRETVWPHGTWVGSAHADFIRGYGYSALGYVWAGFEALTFWAGDSDWSIEEVYDDALVAESLRGQFGKSSPDGLDRRLAQLEGRFLDEFGDDEDLVSVCTPSFPIRTAEAALLQDFSEFRRVFATPPKLEDVLMIEERHRPQVWQFLRRHVRWSVEAAALLYEQLDSAHDDYEEREYAAQLKRQCERALSRLPPAALELIDAIRSLNVLNLVLEPAFSFKGCVGLPIGMIFRLVQHAERRPPLDQIRLITGKWNLFSLAQHRSHDD